MAIKAQQVPGTNRYRGTVNYQGTVLACDHQHATITAARQCGDLYRKVQQARAERAAATTKEA